MKIICHGMKNDYPSKNFFNGKLGENDSAPCHALIDKDRRQIAGMVWVRTVMGIIMAAGIGKGIFFIAAAGVAFVDMQPKDRILAVAISVWDPGKRGGNQNSISDIIKGNSPSQIFCLFGACDAGSCLRRCLLKNFSNILTIVHILSLIHI